MTISILPYKNKTGAAEFTCTSCGQLIFAPIPPSEAVCAHCKFLLSLPVERRQEVEWVLAALERR